jgi:hypothetical protein
MLNKEIILNDFNPWPNEQNILEELDENMDSIKFYVEKYKKKLSQHNGDIDLNNASDVIESIEFQLKNYIPLSELHGEDDE